MTALARSALTSGLRRPALSRWSITFALVAAVGIALRVWVYRGVLGVPDSDKAVVGLMARQILHG